MNDEQKRRAANYVLRAMSQRGWDRVALTGEAGLDPQTVRTFLAGETWPQTSKRQAIEQALGMAYGTLELAARGILEPEPQEEGDEVERAVRRSRLTRANQHKLIGSYYDMLDSQGTSGEVRAG